jgi:starch synthase
VTLRARWVAQRARWVTLRARWVALRARWVALRARWVSLRARWVTLTARWVTLTAMEWVFPEHMRAHELDKGEAVNPMKGAIVTCDRILTVSQGYAYEVTTAEGGFGLDGLLRGRQHVLNGTREPFIGFTSLKALHVWRAMGFPLMCGARVCDDRAGIVNGVDIDDWDPATDENIETHYWPGNMDGKKECKVRA